MPTILRPALLVYVLIGANNDLPLLASIILIITKTSLLSTTVTNDF